MTARLVDTSTLSHFIGSRAREKTPLLVKYVEEMIGAEGLRVSVVTMYEIDRGLRKLELSGAGHTKRRLFTMLASSMTVYGLDAENGRAWTLAADLHARAATHSPAIVFGEADLLILATALVNQLTLVTSDIPLAEKMRAMGFASNLVQIALE